MGRPFGTLWHRAPPDVLADVALALPAVFARIDPRVGLRRVHRTPEESDGRKGRSIHTSVDRAGVEAALATDRAVVLACGAEVERPDVEVALLLPTWMQPWGDDEVYDSAGRGSAWSWRGGAMLHVHGVGWTVDGVCRLFEALVEALPTVEHAAVVSQRLQAAVAARLAGAPAVLRPSRPASPDRPTGQLGLVQFLDAANTAEVGLGDVSPAVAAALGLTRRRGGGAWLRVPGGGDFSAADPRHVAWLDAVLAHVPHLAQSEAPQAPPPADVLREEADRAVAAVIGRRLVSVERLEHQRDGGAVAPGHGPLQLRLDDGTVVHTWPEGPATRLALGPLPVRHARWPHPSGATDRLVCVPCGGGLEGRRVEAVDVGMADGDRAKGWALALDGGGALRVASDRSSLAAVSIEGPGEEAGAGGAEWVWRRVGA